MTIFFGFLAPKISLWDWQLEGYQNPSVSWVANLALSLSLKDSPVDRNVWILFSLYMYDFFIICWSVFFYAVVCPNLDFVLLVVLKRHDIFEPLIKCFLLKLPLKILKIGTGPPGSLLNCKLWIICFGKRWRLNKLYFKLLSSHFIHFKNTMQPLMNIKVL